MHMKETEKEKSSYCLIPIGTTFNAVLFKIKIILVFLVRMMETLKNNKERSNNKDMHHVHGMVQ